MKDRIPMISVKNAKTIEGRQSGVQSNKWKISLLTLVQQCFLRFCGLFAYFINQSLVVILPAEHKPRVAGKVR